MLPTAAPEAASTAGESLYQLVEAPGVLKLNLGAAPHELSQLLQQLPSKFALQLQAAQLLTQRISAGWEGSSGWGCGAPESGEVMLAPGGEGPVPGSAVQLGSGQA